VALGGGALAAFDPSFLVSPPRVDSEILGRFGFYQATGIAVFLAVGGLWAFGALLSYRAKHKTCPDCAETVLSAAGVCRHCGFRWRPMPWRVEGQ
jgi:hypothetical protein